MGVAPPRIANALKPLCYSPMPEIYNASAGGLETTRAAAGVISPAPWIARRGLCRG